MHRAAAVGAFAVDQLTLSPEALARGAVLSFVGTLVDIAVVVHFSENPLNGRHVVVVRRTDETVVRDVHELPEVKNAAFTGNNTIDKLLGRHPGFLCLLLDLLAVLIRPGQEHDVIARQAFVTGDGIGCHRTVCMADVQLIRGIINRGSNVEGRFRHI